MAGHIRSGHVPATPASALPSPEPPITLQQVLSEQPGAPGRVQLGALDLGAARAVLAHFGVPPRLHAGYELPFMLISQAEGLLRQAYAPQMRARQREQRARFQKELPKRGLPFRLGTDPDPLWWRAILAAHHAVPGRQGAFLIDTLDGQLRLAVPGDLLWTDDHGEIRVRGNAPG